jgi:hypothetical protein
VFWFDKYGTDWIKKNGKSYPFLSSRSRTDPSFLKPNSHRTPTFKWHFNLHGTGPAIVSPRPTKPCSHACLNTAARRHSVAIQMTVAHGY